MKTRILIYSAIFFISTMTIFSSVGHSITWIVTVSNFSFGGSGITVSVGDTVKWQYVSGVHTTTNNDATSGTVRPAGAAPWDSPITSTVTQFSYVVTVPGIYIYKCTIHSSMVGNFTAINPPFYLNLTGMMEGFWDGATLVSDTVRVSLHNSVSPFNIIDSAKVKLSSSGTGLLEFSNAPGGNYYISVRHRNSIETWSKDPVTFTPGGNVNYDFTNASNKAFGDNMILKDGKYTFYSGDVNQDGAINLSDVLQIYNDASAFVNGYVVTDVNGDNITDLADVLIAQNNANSFVSVIKPL